MQLKNIALILSLLASSTFAAPSFGRRQDGTPVLTLEAYNDFQISSGTAGNAKAEALALLSGLPTDLSQVTSQDLATIQTERESAENAETEAFNPAIAAASGSAATALQNGKIKNKVLKLTLEVTGLQIELAQGKDVSSQITTEQAKLDNNISLDEAAAGQASTAVSFDG